MASAVAKPLFAGRPRGPGPPYALALPSPRESAARVGGGESTQLGQRAAVRAVVRAVVHALQRIGIGRPARHRADARAYEAAD